MISFFLNLNVWSGDFDALYNLANTYFGGNDDPKGDSDADREDIITLYLWSYHESKEENANLEYIAWVRSN